MGELEVIEEKQNTHGRYIFAGQLRKQKDMGIGRWQLVNRLLLEGFLSIAEVIILKFPSWGRYFHLNFLGRKRGRVKISF